MRQLLNPFAGHPVAQKVLGFAVRHIPHAVGLAILAAAVYFLWNDFAELDWQRTFAIMRNLSPLTVLAALFLTGLNFFVLTFYDVLALKHAGYSLRYSKVALTAFIAYVFSGNLGISMLTGGAVRYRFYTRWKVKARHIAHIMVFSALTLGLGLFLVGGVALLFTGTDTFPTLAINHHLLQLVGVLLLLIVAGYLLLCRIYHKPITWKGVTFSLPSVKLSLAQLAIAGLDWIICCAVLYVLFLDSATQASLAIDHFFLIFILAQLAGVNSHVPGGIGVFDGLMLLMLKPYFPVEDILGILLTYRCIYYMLPFTISLLTFGLMELRYGTRKKKPS
jgi:phosphatidylglycerol lysyltransferase